MFQKERKRLPFHLYFFCPVSSVSFPRPRWPLSVSCGALQSFFMHMQANVNYDPLSPTPTYTKGGVLCAHTPLHLNLPLSVGDLSTVVAHPWFFKTAQHPVV